MQYSKLLNKIFVILIIFKKTTKENFLILDFITITCITSLFRCLFENYHTYRAEILHTGLFKGFQKINNIVINLTNIFEILINMKIFMQVE